MNELNRAEAHALLMLTRLPGWMVVDKIIDKLVQDAVDAALDSGDATKTQRAGGARDLAREFRKTVAGLSDQITSETAPDWR
jgi:hypothetical protein